MKTITLLAAVLFAIPTGACNADEPKIVPDPIDAADVALLLGIHKFQVAIPDEMIGGPVFVKVFYVHPDESEVEIGGCGVAKSGAKFDVLIRHTKDSDRFKVITRGEGGNSTLEKEVKDIGDPQQWFSDKMASDKGVLAVFWNKARIIVRMRPTMNPIWKDDGQDRKQLKAKRDTI